MTRSSKVCFSTVRCPVAMPCRWAHHLRVVVVNGWEGGGLVNKNRSMSIGLEEDASGRGFDLGLIKSSLFHFSLTRGLFLFLDQRPVPTLSHQSPSPMVPTDQTPDTTNKLSLTCGPATPPTLFRGNGHRRPIILATRPAEGGESERAHPQSRFAVASREGHSLITGVTSTSGGPVVREGGREKT